MPVSPVLLQAINFVLSFVLVGGLFALMFRYVPAVKVDWDDALVGAVGTAFLFTIGKLLLGLYLGKASVGSPYGAAGSLVAVVWIYYSAQIFFFGAEFTHLYSEARALTGQAAAGSDLPRQGPSTAPPAVAERVAPLMSMAARAGAGSVSVAPQQPAMPGTLAAPAFASPSAPAQSSPSSNRNTSHSTFRQIGRVDSRAERPQVGILLLVAMGFLAGRASRRQENSRDGSR